MCFTCYDAIQDTINTDLRKKEKKDGSDGVHGGTEAREKQTASAWAATNPRSRLEQEFCHDESKEPKEHVSRNADVGTMGVKYQSRHRAQSGAGGFCSSKRNRLSWLILSSLQ